MGRLIVLLVASVVFYAFWSVPLIGLILVQAVVDFTAGQLIEKYRGTWKPKACLITSMTVNLGILAFFKYVNFFSENIHYLMGDTSNAKILDIVLPPGISFYTFHSMSYTIDVYRKLITPSKSFIRFFLYVMYFPQLVAGPIARAGQLMPQIECAATQPFVMANFASGVRMIIWGMFKKTILADYCGQIADLVYNKPHGYDGWSSLVATYAFTLQIYCDFSAYSEIARGSARLFGIDLVQNFDQPYLVADVSQFWRRWHISLSTWIRDYLYIPLGGNQCGRIRALFNLVVTMFLSGLWHGAAWNFVLWGLFHGFLLLIHTIVTRIPAYAALRAMGGRLWQFFAWLLTFHLVVAGWILFRVKSVKDVGLILSQIGHSFASFSMPTLPQMFFFLFVGVFLFGSYISRRYRFADRIDDDLGFSILFYGILIVIVVLYAVPQGPQFIYFQF